MQIDAKVRLYTKDEAWLCFRHAVVRAMAGQDVETNVDEFDECWMGPTYCNACYEEHERKSNAD